MVGTWIQTQDGSQLRVALYISDVQKQLDGAEGLVALQDRFGQYFLLKREHVVSITPAADN